jgi:hypothetical protein
MRHGMTRGGLAYFKIRLAWDRVVFIATHII